MDDYYAFIVAVDERNEPLLQPVFRQIINERYEIWYYQTSDVPPLSIADYAYSAIPKCYGLVNSTSLEASGILRLQRQPILSLLGQGVFVAVIDTGIRYQDAAFRTEDGKSRIFSMWDQTTEQELDDSQDTLVIYGRTYTNEQINWALAMENTDEIVPETDENGHGTFLASVACGSTAVVDDFTGAAPKSDMIVVKLRDAGKNLRDFYAIPDGTPAYAEHDIMAGIAYAERIAQREKRPLVIFLGLGTNHGGHTGTSPLCDYENMIAATRQRAVINATGNEGNGRHHFFGTAKNMLIPTVAEVDVEKDMRGLWIELWAIAPEQIAVSVQSPTGEFAPRREPFPGQNGSYRFLFEGTGLTVDYRSAGKNRRDQLVYLRFTNITKGIWTIKVYPQNNFTGEFDAWLPMRQMMTAEAFFLESSPDTTLTSPSDAAVPMSVGGYNASTGALFFESGRGPDAAGRMKPDFVAPAVEVQGRGLKDNYVTFSGTSAAAAITAGACAQILQWAVVEKNAVEINSVDIKNLLCRGAARDPGNEYPSNTLGYGKLDVYTAFDTIRK
ncbi:MAG: S8 family peptidase [Agathobacter sp.]|nr:S8 family peptidase [Agathobacter sp.]